MRKFLPLLICVLALSACKDDIVQNSSNKESAYVRVMKTGELRCAYVTYSPFYYENLKSGEPTGIVYDITEEVGKRLGIKIVWSEEVTFQTMYEGLKQGRYDSYCGGSWALAERALQALSTEPLFYSVMYAYVRKDDDRFDSNINAANNSEVKISTIDGEMTDIIAKKSFSKATKVSHPNISDISVVLNDLKTGKSDITFVEVAVAESFLKENQDSIKRVKTSKPIRLFPTVYHFADGENTMLNAFNIAIREIVLDGTLDEIIDEYEEYPNSFIRPFIPYGVSE